MMVPVRLPELATASARLSVWFAEPGDQVYEGDRLVEVLLGAATFDVSSPTTGTLLHRYVQTDEMLETGQLLGVIEEEGDAE